MANDAREKLLAIGPVSLESPFAVAPMAGMTDTAFRRLVKRQGGCGLVVTEMVSSEGLVRGIDRTLEYAEYTEEERPVSIQIFGGDPATMAAAAQIVEGMGADIVDVNMGCPVKKIASHNAGCSLMREPGHAAEVVAAMVRAVKIPVTVKMRAGWDERHVNAPELAKRVEDAGAAAVAIHGRTAAQSYSGESDWDLIARVAGGVRIPVFGSGDCIEPWHVVDRLWGGVDVDVDVDADRRPVSGVLVGRGVLRNPWILAQARDLAEGRAPRQVSAADRGQFLIDYLTLLLNERVDEGDGFRHTAPGTIVGETTPVAAGLPARGREKWVINKLRALMSWYSKGLDRGSELRVRINRAQSIAEVHEIVQEFFLEPVASPAF